MLLETLESIPRSYDAARLFYDRDVAPIFEVILPMTTSEKCIDRIYHYYRDFIVARQNKPFYKGDVTIAEWIGENTRVIELDGRLLTPGFIEGHGHFLGVGDARMQLNLMAIYLSIM